MMPIHAALPQTFADYLQLLGNIPANRIHTHPAPDIAVEALSQANTIAEMAMKRKEYFAAGTQIVWIVDPASRSVAVYNSPLECEVIGGDGILSGGDVLPELQISVAALFAEVDGERRS